MCLLVASDALTLRILVLDHLTASLNVLNEWLLDSIGVRTCVLHEARNFGDSMVNCHALQHRAVSALLELTLARAAVDSGDHVAAGYIGV